MLLAPSTIHHISPKHVFAALGDGLTFVTNLMDEEQRQARCGHDGGVVERCLTTLEVVIEIDHERQSAELAIRTLERPIEVPVKLLADVISVEPESLVDADCGPLV
jgi:hypothetical protein